MDKLIYIRNVPTFIKSACGEREPVKIEFDIAEDITISEFKISCIRLAQALGYSDLNIRDEFGLVEPNIVRSKNVLHG